MVKSTDCDYFIDIEDISSPTRLLYLLTWFTWQKVANLKNCLSVVFLCKSKVSNFVLKLLNYYKISSVECLEKWVGIEGQEPGKTGGGRRKGGKQDLLKIAGSRREIQKGKLSLFGTAYHPVKETNPTIVSWLPFNILRGWKQNFVCKKSQEAKIRTRDKKKNNITSSEWKPFQVAYIIGHEWGGMAHVQVCRLCQLCQCLLCLTKGQENGIWEAGVLIERTALKSFKIDNCA